MYAESVYSLHNMYTIHAEEHMFFLCKYNRLLFVITIHADSYLAAGIY